MNAVVRLQNLSKRFGDAVAVDDVSLDIRDGEFIALLGPSGCGKTTLLRMLGGFERPDGGRVIIDGRDMTMLPPNKRPLNMLFQSYAVFPHMTVARNVGYGLRVTGVNREETARRVDEALRQVRMSEYAARMPDKLSGGQRQRVALARALIKKPRVLLLDEPLSALDAKLREDMQGELVNLQRTVGITFIVVTHDQSEALSMAERIAVMEKGKLRQVAAPRELYEAPASRFVADFIGRMNLFACSVTAAAGECRIALAGVGEITAPDAAAAALRAAAYCGIRPEKLKFAAAPPPPDAPACKAEVRGHVYHGSGTLLQCRAAQGADIVCAHINDSRGAKPPPAGARGWLTWAAEAMVPLPD